MRRYLIPILAILVLASGVLVGCGQRTIPDGTLKTYTSKTYGYSFQYPGDWFIDVKDESSLRIASPNREAYITMVVAPVPSAGAATPWEILKLYVDNAKSSGAVYYEEYHVTDEKVSQKDYPAYELSERHKGKGKQFVWQTKNLIAYKNGKIYDFACSTQETKYALYSVTLDSIYNSLTLR